MVNFSSTAILAIAAAATVAAGPIPANHERNPNAPAPDPVPVEVAPLHGRFGQELRRLRKAREQQPFDHSPYGSGAEPVPTDSADTGFGGRTLF